MSAVPDTHQHVKDLIAAGFTDKQAEALVKTQIGLSGDWATQADIDKQFAIVKADIKDFRDPINCARHSIGRPGGWDP